MPTANEHRQAIAAALSALNKALLSAHDDGFAITLYASSTSHIPLERIGQPTEYFREPARIDLVDMAEFVEPQGHHASE